MKKWYCRKWLPEWTPGWGFKCFHWFAELIVLLLLFIIILQAVCGLFVQCGQIAHPLVRESDIGQWKLPKNREAGAEGEAGHLGPTGNSDTGSRSSQRPLLHSNDAQAAIMHAQGDNTRTSERKGITKTKTALLRTGSGPAKGVLVTLCLLADGSRRQRQAFCQVAMPNKTEEGGWGKGPGRRSAASEKVPIILLPG